MIHVAGLGPGDPLAVPPRVLALLTGGLPVVLRTARHPVVEAGPVADALAALPGGRVGSLDDEYECGASFDDTYAAIVERVLRLHARDGDLVYAVPGHPLVGESTVARLLDECAVRSIPVSVAGAPSFIDACLEAVGAAVTGNLRVIDALSLDPRDPAVPAALRGEGSILLYQVHDRAAASLAKLALMAAGWPDDHPTTVLRSAGVPGLEAREDVPLYALDRRDHDHLTSVWIQPPAEGFPSPRFPDLVRIMARLRDPDTGCPWDREQTHATLRRYVLEEAYEVADAIDQGEPDALCEELGDLLLQVVFHARLAAEEGVFDIDDVCAGICEKLIRRHPHVFGETEARDAEAVLRNWNAIKAEEKASAGKPPAGALESVPRSLPSLAMALEASKRVVKLGFEWPDAVAVLAKAEEEFRELRAEVEAGADPGRIADELGDVLFTLVNVGRKAGVDAEDALRRQVDRFAARWRYVEQAAAAAGVDLAHSGLERFRGWWDDAKRAEAAAKE
ncbi:MAG: nucleoside triphosphate pyrophosphohydrolase [Armatimonadota bacterium]